MSATQADNRCGQSTRPLYRPDQRILRSPCTGRSDRHGRPVPLVVIIVIVHPGAFGERTRGRRRWGFSNGHFAGITTQSLEAM